MGIKGFSSFVQRNSKAFYRELKLESLKAIVVDGNGICHQLYHEGRLSNWELGGEYAEFYATVRSFFSDGMLDKGINPVVIFDGSHDPRKEETVRRRKEEKNSKLFESHKSKFPCKAAMSPILMLQTFIDAVRDLKIQFHVAATEGDKEVACVANSLGCPVLSTDSDFYMFDLTHGYLPFSKFSTGSCSVFHTDVFTTHFAIKDAKLRLLIPAMHGNDFLDSCGRNYDFQLTITMLASYDSCEAFFTAKGKGQVYKNFLAAEKQYSVEQLPSVDEMRSSFVSLYNIPGWTFDEFRRSCFHPHLLDIKTNNVRMLGNVVEDIKKESAWLSSRPIRQHLYGFIGMSADVEENIRSTGSPKYVKELVAPKDTIPAVKIQSFKIGDGSDWIFSVLNIPSDALGDLEEKWWLPIVTTLYWHRSSSYATRHLVKCIILSFLHCSDVLKRASPKIVSSHNADLSALHGFAQWQCTYYDAMALNYVARQPFPATSPSKLFSGSVAMSYAACEEAEVDTFVPESSLFHSLYGIVTSCAKRSLKNDWPLLQELPSKRIKVTDEDIAYLY